MVGWYTWSREYVDSEIDRVDTHQQDIAEKDFSRLRFSMLREMWSALETISTHFIYTLRFCVQA